MKRFLIVCLIVASMLLCMAHFVPKPFEKLVQRFDADATVSICCRQASCNAINLGNGYLVQCKVKNFSEILSFCNQVDGISVSFNATLADFERLQQMFDVSIVEHLQLGNLTVVCGNSRQIRGGVMLNNAQINIQIAFDGSVVTVGSPLILDSY